MNEPQLAVLTFAIAAIARKRMCSRLIVVDGGGGGGVAVVVDTDATVLVGVVAVDVVVVVVIDTGGGLQRCSKDVEAPPWREVLETKYDDVADSSQRHRGIVS